MCFLFTCRVKWLKLLKLSEHWRHWYGCFLAWINKCLFKFPRTENALAQILHRYGLIPVCTLLWTSNALFFWNLMWHILQVKSILPSKSKQTLIYIKAGLPVQLLSQLLHAMRLYTTRIVQCKLTPCTTPYDSSIYTYNSHEKICSLF
jgi:hypothetical protein